MPPFSAKFRSAVFGLVALSLSACVGGAGAPRLDATGASTRGTYPVTTANVANVRLRALETVNAKRAAAGLAPVELSPELNTAADRHSASMSRQGRAWPFGESGDTPVSRARDAGYGGVVLGEVISETYESEVQAIETWMDSPDTRAILMDPAARRIGVGILQEESMKLWWTVTVAS